MVEMYFLSYVVYLLHDSRCSGMAFSESMLAFLFHPMAFSKDILC